MAEKTICPNCNKPCYTAAPEAYNPCPYCASVFNCEGLLIKEQRQEMSKGGREAETRLSIKDKNAAKQPSILMRAG